MKNTIRRSVCTATLLATAASLSGCPVPIQVELGDWLLAVNEDGTPLWGLNLKADGTVESYAYGGTEALDGRMSWVSDGYHLTIERTSATVHHVYDGVLQSPTYAEGDFSILQGVVIGQCYLAKKPITLSTD